MSMREGGSLSNMSPPIKEEREEDAKIIKSDLDFEIAQTRAEFDFWSMFQYKIRFPGERAKMKALTEEDIKNNRFYYRDRLAVLLDRKRKYDKEGYRLPYHPDDEPTEEEEGLSMDPVTRDKLEEKEKEARKKNRRERSKIK